MHVLAVGDISGVAREFGREGAQGAQCGSGQHTAVAANTQHEVGRLEQVDVLITGECAVVPLDALGVEAPPAEPAPKVGLVDAVESVASVGALDARPHIERIVVELGLLVGVERFGIAERPLALAARFRGLSHAMCSSCQGAGVGTATAPVISNPAAQIRRPAEILVGGLRRQARQQQVQTRLKSICRRATSATLRWEVQGAVMAVILPRGTPRAVTGPELRSR